MERQHPAPERERLVDRQAVEARHPADDAVRYEAAPSAHCIGADIGVAHRGEPATPRPAPPIFAIAASTLAQHRPPRAAPREFDIAATYIPDQQAHWTDNV